MEIDLSFLIFGLLTFLWLAEFIIFPSSKKGNIPGKLSFFLVLAGIIISISFSIVMHVNQMALIEGYPGEVLRIIALITYFIGVFLRYWSSKLLGKNFSRNIEAQRDQNLVSKGPYRFLRHPLYIALMIMVVSVSLFLQSLPGILFSVIIMAVVLGVRIKEEEKIMEDNIGKRYINWKKQRYIVIPFVF